MTLGFLYEVMHCQVQMVSASVVQLVSASGACFVPTLKQALRHFRRNAKQVKPCMHVCTWHLSMCLHVICMDLVDLSQCRIAACAVENVAQKHMNMRNLHVRKLCSASSGMELA